MGERRSHTPEEEAQPDEEKMPKALFDMGQVVITRGALIAIEVAEHHPVQFLARHVSGDWGNLPEEDVEENEFSLERGFRLFSAYDLDTGGKIYVITEWDRSVTTLLTPDEY